MMKTMLMVIKYDISNSNWDQHSNSKSAFRIMPCRNVIHTCSDWWGWGQCWLRDQKILWRWCFLDALFWSCLKPVVGLRTNHSTAVCHPTKLPMEAIGRKEVWVKTDNSYPSALTQEDLKISFVRSIQDKQYYFFSWWTEPHALKKVAQLLSLKLHQNFWVGISFALKQALVSHPVFKVLHTSV